MMKKTLELMKCGLAIRGMDRPINWTQGRELGGIVHLHITLAKDLHLCENKLLEISNIVSNTYNISSPMMDGCDRCPFHYPSLRNHVFPICLEVKKKYVNFDMLI
jgi:hypothetical protein